ncbi:phage tail protein [Serratia sp. Ag1]|uniref:TipJ family phage tail tip protein n=1 Tax=Serratia sp. Ag1 TaxID=1524467 RepID=UPI0004FF70C9|nr:phage tail protein [Serratia sp. Ag1]KFK98138.1 host specificity protein [Serratia sp. Ag1]
MTNIIKGHKGGSGGGRTPVESPDSIQSIARAKILLALGEGEWVGGLDGKNIYLNGTPLTNEDGTDNFSGVTWEFRPGTQHQDYIQGIPAVENEITVNTTLKNTMPWVRSISNTQLSAVRVRFGWANLIRQEDNGDVNGTRVEYAIDLATDGGAYQEVLKSAVDGKTTTLYERSHRINLPKAVTGWQIRARRITADSSTARVTDAMTVEAITEVIDAKLRYPNTALLFIEFDAKQFPNIPKISCKPKMAIIRVPDNYDPVTRTYTGTWYGGFKWAHSNNPAWVFYDIVTSSMYGLGNRIDSSLVKEEELYRIAQYCDQLVPDGRGGGGKEPRFTCDVYIQSRKDAWTVLSDLAAIFRGMTYWGQNQLVALADMPRDVDYIYTRANVINGKFAYSASSERVRYTTAMVAWSDPDNHYADAVEAVFDNDLARRYGTNQTELTVIGCTRQSEANRRGRWALLTNSKDRVVSFSVGLDGVIPLPGHIIGVADQMLAGRAIGGRIRSVSGRNITLDRKPDAKVGDRLIINLPSGRSQARTIQAVSGNTVTVTANYSETPAPESAWSIDADDLAIQQYRVIGIADNGDNTYSITAAQHDPNKYAYIDDGARLEDRPVSIIPPGVQGPPKNVKISETSAMIQGLSVATLRVTWDSTENAIAYEVEWRRDNGNWVAGLRTSALGIEVQGIYAGRYQARVRAINAAEISSIWANAPEATLSGKIGEPPALASFTTTGQVFGIVLNWAFPPGAEDTQRTEIWYSTQPDGAGAMHLGDYAYPQRSHTMTGLNAGVRFWFQARLVDRLGNTGPWTAWTEGTSSSEADVVLGYLKDQITKTQLAQELQKPIEDASKLQDMWSVKVAKTIDGKQYLAGIGVGVENTPDGMQSQVLINANRFAVLNSVDGTAAGVSIPFAIDKNQVFMNAAFIKDGSITNAKIGESITSYDWVWNADPAKTIGWAIDKRGAAWFNNVYIRGTIHADSGYFKGAIYADSGYFKGDITGSNGTFKGTVYAENLIGDNTHVGVWSPVYVVGANDSTHRYFHGGLPYPSVVVIPYVTISVYGTGSGAGSVYIKINGVEYWSAHAGPTSVYRGSIVIDVPANGTLDVEFGITGAERGLVWTSTINPGPGTPGTGGEMAVIAFRKGQNRFS